MSIEHLLLMGKWNWILLTKGWRWRSPSTSSSDVAEQLLIGEGVCRQLGIVTYHSLVSKQRKKENVQAGKQVTKLADKGEARDKERSARNSADAISSAPETKPGKEGELTTTTPANGKRKDDVSTETKESLSGEAQPQPCQWRRDVKGVCYEQIGDVRPRWKQNTRTTQCQCS